ncbi:MAG: hypothetical protein IKX62_00830 [Bacteroidales bacterium]|nr:hypothetical protein [Bacteroidales bacterium]
MNLLKYSLTLGGKTISNDAKTDLTIGDYKLDVSLYGVSFQRQVYQPGHIEAEILMSTEEKTEPSAPDVDALMDFFLNKSVSLSVNQTVVAKNYYVHEISPQYEKGRRAEFVKIRGGKRETYYYKYDIYVKLDIFSPDKKMTLNKYSQAHLGRRLVADIVKNSLYHFGSIEMETRVLHNLSYEVTIFKKTRRYELVQPYLVQYNETFYDFLSRVANRCGEVFYFEDGKLCFGLPDTEKKTSITNASRVIFQRYSSKPITVKDYARDAVKQERTVDGSTTYALEKNKILTDPVKKGTDDYPDDAFPRYEVGEFPYNSEISPEDQYMILYKNKFARDDLNSLWVGDKIGKTLEVVAMILESTSLLEVMTNFATSSIHSAIQAHTKTGETNKKGNDSIGDADYKVLFTNASEFKDHWVTLKYHQDIRSREEEQMRKTVCVDMGQDYADVKLGDRISLPNDSKHTYVVVRIEMTSGVKWNRSYEELSGNNKMEEEGQTQRIYAIPMYEKEEGGTTTSVFYPPLLPGQPFRQSGPQPAFIYESGDWKNQGRVRVRFPWQPKYDADAKQTALNNAQKELEKYATFDTSGKPVKKKEAKQADYDAALTEYNRCKTELAVANEAAREDATPWIRMSTPMATSGGGMYFKPEKGDEVMVDFENGNIEHPYVVGTLYSKNVTVPDGSRIIQSKNGHTIKMSDPNDGSLLLAGMYPGLKLLKNYGVEMHFMDDKVNEVLGGIEMSDKYGFYKIKMSSHDRCVSIASPFGDVKMSAFSGIKINAPNGDIKIVGKNVDITAYNKLKVTSGKNIDLGLDQYRLGYLAPFTKGDKVGEAAGSIISSFYADFFDLSFIRSILEVFIRPVDGTLSIKSNRYLMMEAGKGKAAAIPSNYNEFEGGGGQEGKSLVFAVPYIRETLDKYIQEYCKLFNNVNYAIRAFFRWLSSRNWPSEVETPTDLTTLLTSLFALDEACLAKGKDFDAAFDTFAGDETKFKIKTGTEDGRAASIKGSVKGLMRAVLALKKFHLGYDTMFADLTGKGVLPPFGSRFENFFRFGTVRYHHKAIGFTYDEILKMTKPEVPAPNVGDDHIDVLGNATLVGGQPVGPAPDTPTPAAEDGGSENGFYHAYYLKVQKFIDNASPDAAVFTPDVPSLLKPNVFNSWKKIVCRRLICALIEFCRGNNNPFDSFKVTTNYPAGTTLYKPETPFSDHDWASYISGISFEKKKQDSNWGWDFLSGLAEGAIFEPLSKLALFEISPWKADAKGEILFSDKENVSFRFADNGSVEKTIAPGRIEADAYLVREALKSF